MLTLVTVVLWSAVIGWKLQRKEQANGYGGGARGAQARRGGYPYRDDDRYREERPRYDDPPRYDDRPRKAQKAPGRAPRGPRSAARAEVEINPGKCARFAFCEQEAPEIFKLTGERIDYKTSVPADQIDAVAMAVKVCPARAIKMKVHGPKP
jgi:ferredoxin